MERGFQRIGPWTALYKQRPGRPRQAFGATGRALLAKSRCAAVAAEARRDGAFSHQPRLRRFQVMKAPRPIIGMITSTSTQVEVSS